MFRATSMAIVVGSVCLGCGGAPPSVAKAGEAKAERPVQKLALSAEIGALDEEKVNLTLKKSAGKIAACYGQGAQRVPFLAGDIRFSIRVSQGGSARWAFVKESTIGDRATEECMLGVLKSASWPSPEGGQEGLAETGYGFDASPDERPPLAWSAAELGPGYEEAKPLLSACRAKASTGPLQATLYVDTAGKAIAVGVAGSDEKAEGAVACIVETLKAATFASPGSYAAKVGLTVE